jgi:hypothetical protein
MMHEAKAPVRPHAPILRLMARMVRVVEADHGLFVRREHISRAYFYLFRVARGVNDILDLCAHC